MARQILTFVVIFAGVMLLMRTCTPKPEAPAAIVEENVVAPQDDEIYTIEDAGGRVRAVVGLTGTIVSIEQDGRSVLRTVPPWRRPFHLLVNYADGSRRAMPRAKWSNTRIEGGREFTCSANGLAVTKRILLDPEGGGLRCELSVDGAGDEVRGLEFTGASGPRLADGEEIKVGAFWKVDERKEKFHRLGELVRKREEERAVYADQMKRGTAPPRPAYDLRKLLGGGREVARFGILGATHYLALEDLEGAEALNVGVYRSRREGDRVDDEIESWVSLPAPRGVDEWTFRLRWTTREESPLQWSENAEQKSREYTLENDTMRVVLTDDGASIKAMWLKGFTREAGERLSPDSWVPIVHEGVRPGDRPLTLHCDPDTYGADPAHRVWEITEIADGRRFTFESPTGYRLTKTITLPAEGHYDLGVEISVRPPAGSDVSSVKYSIVGPAGAYVEDSYRGIFGAAPPAGLLLERGAGDSEEESIDNLLDDEPLMRRYATALSRGYLRAVAMRGAYFVVALVTPERRDRKGAVAGNVVEAQLREITLDRAIERNDGDESNESVRGQLTAVLEVAEGGAAVERYRFYAGPTALDDLRPLQLEEAVDYGMFGPIGRFLMWLMKQLQSLVGSFGVAIVFMTIIVRGCLLPVSYRTQLGMQRYSKRLQKIKPLLDQIQEKHKNNRQKLNQERMKVMREHKVGFPLGCLMIFVQFPIWIALFGALRVEFSLRHQPFLWATDLSMPDRLFPLPFFEGLPFLPDHFNLLPILMLVLWVFQQRLTPQPGGDDPQVKMQMKMIKFMPYMFFLMLYSYAAALALYMCVSSAWGIAESKLVRRAIARLD